MHRSRLDAAFIKVSTGLAFIDRILRCSINGAWFSIRVEEIRCCSVDSTLDPRSSEEEVATSEESDQEEEEMLDVASVEAGGLGDQTSGSDGEETVVGRDDASNSINEAAHTPSAVVETPEKVTSTSAKSLSNFHVTETRSERESKRPSGSPNTRVGESVNSMISRLNIGDTYIETDLHGDTQTHRRSTQVRISNIPYPNPLGIEDIGPGEFSGPTNHDGPARSEEAEDSVAGAESINLSTQRPEAHAIVEGIKIALKKPKGDRQGGRRKGGKRRWKTRARESKSYYWKWNSFIRGMESGARRSMSSRPRANASCSDPQVEFHDEGRVFCQKMGLEEGLLMEVGGRCEWEESSGRVRLGETNAVSL